LLVSHITVVNQHCQISLDSLFLLVLCLALLCSYSNFIDSFFIRNYVCSDYCILQNLVYSLVKKILQCLVLEKAVHPGPVCCSSTADCTWSACDSTTYSHNFQQPKLHMMDPSMQQLRKRSGTYAMRTSKEERQLRVRCYCNAADRPYACGSPSPTRSSMTRLGGRSRHYQRCQGSRAFLLFCCYRSGNYGFDEQRARGGFR
jgi:hypothetical protein